MTPDRFAKLATTKDGRPVVHLMADPDMEDGFLSLVNKGANGRRVSVVKAADLASTPEGEIVSDLGQPTSGVGWWARLFSGLFRTSTPVSKGDAPTTFDAAYAMDRMRGELWRATDQLTSVVWNIMGDADLTDKVGALRLALDQFKDHVIGLASVVQVSKLEDRTAVAKAAIEYREQATKAGRVLSASSLSKIVAAEEALSAALAALGALHEAAGTATKAGEPLPDPASPLGESMKLDPAMLAAVAKASGATAIEVAKSAGLTDATALAQIGVNAQTEVFKAAVQGPPQPGLPTTVLQDQHAQSAGASGSPSAPEGAILAKLNQLGTMVAKVADEVLGAADAAGNRTGGITAVVEKHGEILDGMATVVQKMAGTPRASNAGGDGPRASVKKGTEPEENLGATFAGTGLSFLDKPAGA